MEVRMLIGLLAATAAFACAFALAATAATSLMRRRSAMAAQGDRFTMGSLVAWRMRNGFAFAIPAATRLLKRKRVKELTDEAIRILASRNWGTTRESLVSVAIAILGALVIVISLLLRNAVGAIACAICAIAVTATALANEKDKRNEEIREAIPEALESMGACFSSGFTLLQTFNQVANEVPGALGDTFARCAHVLEIGGSAEEALEELRSGTYAAELAFVAVALDVQHQSGGTIRQVLSSATEAVKGTLSLRRSLRVQTAQARLSARVVAVMPFVLVAAFSVLSPDFLMPFFSSPLGYALLGIAVAMQAAGILLVRRALSVDGVA